MRFDLGRSSAAGATVRLGDVAASDGVHRPAAALIRVCIGCACPTENAVNA